MIEKAMATRNECHLSQLFFGGIPTNCEKKSQKESNYILSYCSWLTHVFTFSDLTTCNEKNQNEIQVQVIRIHSPDHLKWIKQAAIHVIWNDMNLCILSINTFFISLTTTQPRRFLVRDKRSAFHPHGGTCMGKLLLPSTTVCFRTCLAFSMAVVAIEGENIFRVNKFLLTPSKGACCDVW